MIHSPPSIFHLPMSSPDLTAAEIEAVSQVLQTPYLSLGPRTTVQGCRGARVPFVRGCRGAFCAGVHGC